MGNGKQEKVERTSSQTRSHGLFLFLILFGLGMVYVFAPVLSPWRAIASPDTGPYYQVDRAVRALDAFLAGKSPWMPHHFLVLFNPLAFHDWAYVLCQFSLGLSGVYYLRTQRLSWLASCAGGLFLAFSGYIFTLFCAGHLGFFQLFSCVFWSLGLLNRCFETRRPVYFALLGCVLMWGQPSQPDVWVLAVALLAAYAVWLTFSLRKGETSSRLLLGLIPRFALTLAVVVLVGAMGVRQVFSVHLAGRDRQIERASPRQSGGGETNDPATKKRERWIFATNWSLPPEDMAEFVVPGIFGNASFRPPHPYWGRLGQPFGFQPGRMMPNFRQHTVYLGIVPVVLALFGVWGWNRRRLSPPLARLTEARFTDVPFWAGVWIVCLLLALGRYTPVYRLFYALPYMDYLRAPVKLLHLTELATAFLAAFGAHALLAAPRSSRLWRNGAIGSSILAGLFLGSVFWTKGNGGSIERHIATLGLAPFAQTLRGYATENLLRSAGFVAMWVVVLCLAARKEAGSRGRMALATAIVALGVADMASVARRFVDPIDVKPFHEANAVVKAMMARTGGRPAHIANYVTSGEVGRDWFGTALWSHGHLSQLPNPHDPDDPARRYLEAFKNDPVRYWRVMGVRFVLLSSEQMQPFHRHGILRPVCDFQLGAGTVLLTGPGANTLTVGEFAGTGLPAAHFAWRGETPAEQQAETARATAAAMPVTDAPAPAEHSEIPPRPLVFDHCRGQRGVLATRGTVTLPAPGLIVFQERYSPDLEVLLDGRPVPVYRADGLWGAVVAPAGTYGLECRVKRDYFLNLVALGTSLAVAAWGLMCPRARAGADA